MPALPCATCQSLVDVQDLFCKKCNDKQPFTCSKCGVRLDARGLFEPEKLAFKKTPFCSRCGPENAVVQCAQCKTSLVKATGRTRMTSGGQELVYHMDCWTAYEKQDKTAGMLLTMGAPAAGILVAVIGMVITHNFVSALESGVVAAIITAVGGIVIKPKG